MGPVQWIQEKTGGKIIQRAGGVVYVYRGRNYNYKNRPNIPLMLWKPPAPIYPKLIQTVPEGLTKEEAYKLRSLGRNLSSICRLGTCQRSSACVIMGARNSACLLLKFTVLIFD